MPTLIHLLLVFGSLLLGLRVAMADALPDDTNAIETLTVEQARELVERFPGVEVEFKNGRHPYSLGGALPLKGLKTLDAEVARALAGYGKGPLVLDGLTTLDADTAAALAEVSGVLSLAGLATLDADTAAALAKFAGPQLALGGITAFDSPDSVAVAKALATRQGPLSLPNLEKISPKTLTALIEKQDVEIPLIETLELIPEPDGSATEDFVIPERFQQPR
jgi:hypothetical protein